MNMNEFFEKKYTGGVKGLAIILMITLHLLQKRWLQDTAFIIDFRIHGIPVSSIVAYACDICIGMFAFITGYGWARSFNRKPVLSRIIPVYQTYYVVLLLFSLPARFINCQINSEEVNLSIQEIILSVLGIRSNAVMFQWYVFFYACACITFSPLWAVTKRSGLKTGVKVLLLIAISILPRVFLSFFWRIVPASLILRDELSHYISWMPVILLGAMTREFNLFERIENNLSKLFNSKKRLVLSIFFFVACIVGKAFFEEYTGINTNIDALYILPFMFSVIFIIRTAYETVIERALRYLGGVSIYLWFMHRVFLYSPLREWTLHLRIPALIVVFAVIAMIPFAVALQRINDKIDAAIFKKRNP